ncbi:hypothetical protein H2279_07815 [Campylobacter sp. B0100352/1]|uniref:hypothetical protein n=1 Tax=Campylobacter sp. B0100352/1 TaxID=2735783 RepID=UPI001D4D1553|nr:hypothetical protein [Campylobacter sp. B0100352/1]
MKNIKLIDILDQIKDDLQALALFCTKMGISTRELYVEDKELYFISNALEHNAKLIKNVSDELNQDF